MQTLPRRAACCRVSAGAFYIYILDSLLGFLSDLQIESLYCYFVQLHCDLRGFTVKILQQPIPPTSHYQRMLCGMGPIVIKAVVFLNAEADTTFLISPFR